jgi:hypothetical protein
VTVVVFTQILVPGISLTVWYITGTSMYEKFFWGCVWHAAADLSSQASLAQSLDTLALLTSISMSARECSKQAAKPSASPGATTTPGVTGAAAATAAPPFAPPGVEAAAVAAGPAAVAVVAVAAAGCTAGGSESMRAVAG